ncbi:MAG: AAA family ATPase [Rhizobiales bacterium]|nr:AAA family ATPase [Hyphomicrobiales bacterium]
MQLRFLLVSGPNSPPASVDFGPGLNVIYGGSNTGKTHILRLIDYVLGAKSPPEAIVEQAGYDFVHLGVVLDDGSEKTFVRALQGGHVKVLDGLTRIRPGQSDGVSASAQHAAQNSLSRLLLAQLGAANARVRTDASGKTRDLSFRDLERHTLVSETKIQDGSSPVLSGQFVTKTAETSVFKYMLTGVDDIALDATKTSANQPLRQAAQLELLDRQIRDIEHEIEEADQDQEELLQQDSALDAELSQTFSVQETTEAAYRELTSNRLELRREHESLQDRVGEIDTLTERFKLLAEHYRSDVARLASIVEAGTYYTLEGPVTCPVCGSAAKFHRPDQACDGNVADITAAAEAEIADVHERATELQETIAALETERAERVARMRELLPQIHKLQENILREVPAVQTIRSRASAVIARKLTVQRSLELVRRRDTLVAQRTELGFSPGYDSSTIVAQQQLDGATLDQLSQMVESELQSWQFPDAQRVFFEVPKMDISVSGKPRAANGKGVRALLHGAFSIALMKFCRNRDRAHPGFLILDSLFITYRDPSDAGDSAIAGTPLKDRAFKAFSKISHNLQLIILENVDVPEWLDGQPYVTHFTGNAAVGRAGLFPK